ncbi:Imm52 family immunity protein [Streptomyces sp. URMC 129]|uniref:Imm52 family immunity protein n=1 Tax=Streptomyces sp. URMC 129 TaxID=3423407 RepID=UPI003F1ADC5E
MTDTFYLGAYWGPRAESAGECAARLGDCLQRLGTTHPALATWFRKGKSKAAASNEAITVNNEALEALLLAGRSRTDIGGDTIDELGFRASLWNRDPLAVSLSTTCGAHPATNSVMNYFTLTLPEPLEAATELYEPDVARAVFRAVVEAWSPTWATYASYAMRERQRTAPGQPVGGWLTYLDGKLGSSTQNRPEVSVEPFASGVLVTAGTDPLNVSDAQLASVVNFLSATH